MKSIAIIPARMAASRFPGKPLVKINGIPMIGHIYHRTTLKKCFDEVYVATCDQEIVDYIESIGGKAVMTADTHERCTDRTAEALQKIEAASGIKYDIIGMVQGDEPTVVPDVFVKALDALRASSDLSIVNIMNMITSDDEFRSPNSVKVIIDKNSNAITFSREPIPSNKKFNGEYPKYRQTGLIFFKRDFLIEFNNMAPTMLEEVESVDMMRLIENGIKVKMILAEQKCLYVDIPEHIGIVEDYLKSETLFQSYRGTFGVEYE